MDHKPVVGGHCCDDVHSFARYKPHIEKRLGGKKDPEGKFIETSLTDDTFVLKVPQRLQG